MRILIRSLVLALTTYPFILVVGTRIPISKLRACVPVCLGSRNTAQSSGLHLVAPDSTDGSTLRRSVSTASPLTLLT